MDKYSKLKEAIKNIELQLPNNRKFEIPLQYIDNKSINYLATEIVKNDIMQIVLN